MSRQNLPDPPEGSLIFLGSPPSLVVNFTKIPLFVCNILLAALISPSVPSEKYAILHYPPSPFPQTKMMTISQVSVIAIYTYTERNLSRQTRPCSLLSDHICR